MTPPRRRPRGSQGRCARRRSKAPFRRQRSQRRHSAQSAVTIGGACAANGSFSRRFGGASTGSATNRLVSGREGWIGDSETRAPAARPGGVGDQTLTLSPRNGVACPGPSGAGVQFGGALEAVANEMCIQPLNIAALRRAIRALRNLRGSPEWRPGSAPGLPRDQKPRRGAAAGSSGLKKTQWKLLPVRLVTPTMFHVVPSPKVSVVLVPDTLTAICVALAMAPGTVL